MKTIGAVLAAVFIAATALTHATAGPGPQGVSSDNIEQVAFLPFEAGTATGANFWRNGKDHYMIVTGWRSFSIYNVTDPAAPVLESITPFGFQFENEDVATNGEIMLFSESLPNNILHVWNIEDVTNPVETSQVPGAGQHTTSCLLDCKWAYGSSGAITDLRDPANPKLMDSTWKEAIKAPIGSDHDVTEVAPGLVITASQPIAFLDARKNPVKPKLLALSEPNEQVGEAPVHSNLWPRNAKDKFMLVTGESWAPTNGGAQCTEDRNQGFSTWDATKWKSTKTFKKIDTFKSENGTISDGGAVVNAPFGCSSHWFTYHPKWRNGGLVASGWYTQGTRVLQVNSKGKISEVGWFLPHAGATSGAYWVDNEYIYAVDYQRGVDILRYTGKA